MELLTKITAISWLWSIITAILILVIGYIVINIISGAVKNTLLKSKVDTTLHTFIVKGVKILLWIVVIVMLLQKLGVNTASLVALIGAAGAAIALALKDSLANVAGGILILLNKPFKNGDEIEVAGQATGIVDTIDIMATKLHTWDNKIVTVPNGSVVTSVVLNYTESGFRRLQEQFGITPGTDIDLVKSTIKSAIAKEAIFATEPAPIVGATGNGEGSIIFDVLVWCKAEDYYGARYVLREAVAKALGEAGIGGPVKDLKISNAN